MAGADALDRQRAPRRAMIEERREWAGRELGLLEIAATTLQPSRYRFRIARYNVPAYNAAFGIVSANVRSLVPSIQSCIDRTSVTLVH